MKKIDCIAEGLRILSAYDESGYSVTVEHDQLWAGPESCEGQVSEADAQRLEKRGWVMGTDVERWTIFP